MTTLRTLAAASLAIALLAGAAPAFAGNLSSFHVQGFNNDVDGSQTGFGNELSQFVDGSDNDLKTGNAGDDNSIVSGVFGDDNGEDIAQRGNRDAFGAVLHDGAQVFGRQTGDDNTTGIIAGAGCLVSTSVDGSGNTVLASCGQ